MRRALRLRAHAARIFCNTVSAKLEMEWKMKTTIYKNPWHKAGHRTEYGPEFYETSARPTEYRGYLIFHRQSDIWDIVKDSVCVSQFAGFNGAKRYIDQICTALTVCRGA